MIPIPRLQTAIFGISLRVGTLAILYTVMCVSFVGLVIMTSLQVNEDRKNQTEGELDLSYVFNTVISICGFLATPLALYGTHHERYNFLVPYMVVHVAGAGLLAINTFLEFINLMNETSGTHLQVVIVLFVMTALFVYSILVLHSYYCELKEQREEIK